MNNLNSIVIEGNMVRDPDFRETAKGIALCAFSIATNRFFKLNGETTKETGYFDVEAWSKLAESCRDLGRKGRGVKVVGRLKQSRWNDADGNVRSKVSIVAEHVEFRHDFKKGDAPAAETEEPENFAVSF